jgi:hypothetical protein
MWALLALYQALRTAIAVAVQGRPRHRPVLQTGHESGLTRNAVVSLGSFGTHSAQIELERSPMGRFEPTTSGS